MKKEPRWLNSELVIAVHERLLAEFGGAAGVRDRGLVESALGRPKHRWHYETPDLFELAATYAYGIASNHPFVDGNKRSAFMAALVFLTDNGQHFQADEAQVVLMTLGLAAGSVTEPQYAEWLRVNCITSHS